MNTFTTTLSCVICAFAVGLSGCNSQTVRSASVQQTPAVAQTPIPEHLLLDVGVDVFDPGIEFLDERKSMTTPGVRKAEGVYAAGNVARTLQTTGNWGAVRIIPGAQSETDVYVDGVIVKSDGETLTLEVTVQDSSGKPWYTRRYSDQLSQYAYDPSLRQQQEPFQGLYNRIARDMETYVRQLPAAEREELRAISKLRFAQRFAPEDYNDFMSVSSRGQYTLKRLPAAGDPVIQHVESIRVRDQMFVDLLQEHYRNFNQRLQGPYDQWRESSYRETKELRRLKGEATARKIGGVLAVVAGVLAQGSGSRTARSAGVLGIGAGAYMFKSGLDRGSEARIYEEGLREMADSLDAEIQPHTFALADKTVTLSGTVDEQYAQWRAILNEIYLSETGQAPTRDLADPQPE